MSALSMSLSGVFSSACILLVTSASAHDVFQDCRDCPRMVAIPAGTFTMGSPADEPGRGKYEGPRADVEVERFAIGETEVTVAQYIQFAKETGRPAAPCYSHGDLSQLVNDYVNDDARASWDSPGFEQTLSHPVVCVSWSEANEYATWLARKTGKPYRLPSEAEWEYAARAGTTTAYYWGPSADRECEHMNGVDLSALRTFPALNAVTDKMKRQGAPGVRIIDCDDGSAATAAVGTYKPNAFGLKDMSGNVWELVAGCWTEALPPDGWPQASAAPCDRMTRGGSWDDWPRELRSARRGRLGADSLRRTDTGFRVSRALSRDELSAVRTSATKQ